VEEGLVVGGGDAGGQAAAAGEDGATTVADFGPQAADGVVHLLGVPRASTSRGGMLPSSVTVSPTSPRICVIGWSQLKLNRFTPISRKCLAQTSPDASL